MGIARNGGNSKPESQLYTYYHCDFPTPPVCVQVSTHIPSLLALTADALTGSLLSAPQQCHISRALLLYYSWESLKASLGRRLTNLTASFKILTKTYEFLFKIKCLYNLGIQTYSSPVRLKFGAIVLSAKVNQIRPRLMHTAADTSARL